VARLTARGETVEQPFTVRLDPRLKASADDVAEQGRAVGRLIGMECSIRQATEEIAGVDKQLAGLEQSVSQAGLQTEVSAVRAALRGVRDRFESDPRGPAPLNLARKITRMREEVEGYTGRPTAAQVEWAGIFERQLQETLRSLDGVLSSNVARLNERLTAAGIPQVAVGPARRR
jgi:hypothetical protein